MPSLVAEIKEYSDENQLPLLKASERFRNEFEGKIIAPARKLFSTKISTFKKEAAEFRQVLFSDELEQLKQLDINEYLLELILTYNALKWFPSEKIFERLQGLGLKRRQLQWFINIQDIKNEFEKINESGIILINPVTALNEIHAHLFGNIVNEIYLSANKVGKKRSGSIYNEAHNNLFDLLRNKEYSKVRKKKPKPNANTMLSEVLELVNGIPNIDLKKQMLSLAQGKTDKTCLKKIFTEHCFLLAEGNDPYIAFYDLLRLLQPAKDLLSKNEFEISKKAEVYDWNYRKYQLAAVKQVVSK